MVFHSHVPFLGKRRTFFRSLGYSKNLVTIVCRFKVKEFMYSFEQKSKFQSKRNGIELENLTHAFRESNPVLKLI